METTADDPVFVDTNILVYATMLDSPFHAPALLIEILPLVEANKNGK